MKTISYHRHRFPPEIIKQAIWLYFRFTMSYRDVEELLAERGITVSDSDHKFKINATFSLLSSFFAFLIDEVKKNRTNCR